MRRHLGFRLLEQPALTPSLGLTLLGSTQNNWKPSPSAEKNLYREIIQQLPSYDHFCLNFSPQITNWLPFHWAGFTQTTRYTYVLNDLSDIDALWKSFHSTTRREIRKAENRFGVHVKEDATVEEFIRLNQMIFKRQAMHCPYSDAYVHRLDSACVKHSARRIFIAEDEHGKQHAGVYVVWDSQKAYYLMGGGDPHLRTSGATSLCMWKAIQFAATVSKTFDFEGSMLEPVEHFFRSFSPTQTPYFQVSRTPSKILRSYFHLKKTT